MGSNFRKRLSRLQEQVDETKIGQIGFLKAFAISFGVFLVLGIILPSSSVDLRGSAAKETDPNIRWIEETSDRIEERVRFLEAVPLGGAGADLYLSFARGVIETLVDRPTRVNQQNEEEIFSLNDTFSSLKRSTASAALRIGFILFSFWGLWLIGAIAGAVGMWFMLKPNYTNDVLGVCHRTGKGSFYSGIFGPFHANNSVSGTDFSCPGLACPKMEDRKIAFRHNLVKTLRDHRALNETNLSLVQVILAYKDFPSVVEDEAGEAESQEQNPASNDLKAELPGGFVAKVDVPLEQCALEGLGAVLQAHEAIVRFAARKQQQQSSEKNKQAQFGAERKLLMEEAASLTPLARTLILALTPAKRNAIAQLPTAAVASAYLAIEAGKSLVYKRVSGGFSQISRFPHLQARAVLQSVVGYHRDYNGDLRLCIRQAVICSRRHGDFGRVFIPNRMPLSSRALRDWLEILIEPRDRRIEAADLTELDAHLAEVHQQWRHELVAKLQGEAERLKAANSESQHYPLSNGIVYKSVVLMPLKQLIEESLRDFGDDRLKRIAELIESTREQYRKLRVSARLPGYSRQSVDLEKDEADMIAKAEKSAESHLLSRWIVVRRMLMQYNWLSTRVGDHAVPVNGLVQGLVILRSQNEKHPEVLGLDALVPLRQRRFRDLFGAEWERQFYLRSPDADDIELFVDEQTFNTMLRTRIQQAQRGELVREVIPRTDDLTSAA